jgi:hypothetical protein
MSAIRVISAIAVLLVATSAAAFQEQRQDGPAPDKPSAAMASGQPSAPAITPVAPSSQGTEVRVPGFGRLGTLPKIDFGLELLYGGADHQKQVQPQAQPADPTDGMALRGSIRHKF